MCLFILSGFFLYKSYIKRPDMPTGEFVLRKIARLWGVLALFAVITTVFYQYDVFTNFINILFLQSVGLSANQTGINWFVSPLFWTLIFYFVLAKCTKKERTMNLITGVISYFSFVIVLNYGNFKLSRDTAYGIFSLSELAAVGCIGAGWLIAAALNHLYSLDSVRHIEYTKRRRAALFVISSAAELFSAAMLGVFMLWREKAGDNMFLIVVFFSILLVCFVGRNGILSRLLDREFFGFFGRYAYSIYIMQQISFYIMQKTLWGNTDFVVNHAYRTIAVSVLAAVLLGVLVYYICEKPTAKLIRAFSDRLYLK